MFSIKSFIPLWDIVSDPPLGMGKPRESARVGQHLIHFHSRLDRESSPYNESKTAATGILYRVIIIVTLAFLFHAQLFAREPSAATSHMPSQSGSKYGKNPTQHILIDFGIDTQTTASPDINGNWWNNLSTDNATAPSGTLQNLLTTANINSGIQLSVSGFGNGANEAGSTVPDTEALGSLGVASSTRDNFFVGGGSGLVAFAGLSPLHYYRLECFGSRDAADTRVTLFTAIGFNTVSATMVTSGAGIGAHPQPNANRSYLAVLDNLRPTAGGTVNLSVAIESGSFGYLGALRVTQLSEVSAANLPPEVDNPLIVGAPAAGRSATVHYNYFDADGDIEGESIIAWQFDTPPFSNPLTLSSGSANSIMLPEMEGSYYRAAITPRALSGEAAGTVTYSDWKGPIAPSDAVTVFHIGNSFTRWGNIPRQLQTLAHDAGFAHVYGEQLTDGMGLEYHWMNGLQSGVWSRGTPSRLELETGSWDWLVLQPMSREWQPGQLDSMMEHAQYFADLAAANDTGILLYQYWNYYDEAAPVQESINAAFLALSEELASNGINALIIPSGEAFSNAVTEISGIGKADLYQDNIHPSDAGYYLSALVHFAVIYQQSPLGLTNSSLSADYYNDDTVYIDLGLANDMQITAWDSARYNSNTGITIGRYNAWAAGLPEGSRGLTDIPFPDGISNIRRWVHGLPRVNGMGLERMAKPLVNGSGAWLEYSLGADAMDAGAILVDEWSEDLVEESWTSDGPEGFIRNQSGDDVQWQLGGNWRAMFYRNRILLP